MLRIPHELTPLRRAHRNGVDENRNRELGRRWRGWRCRREVMQMRIGMLRDMRREHITARCHRTARDLVQLRVRRCEEHAAMCSFAKTRNCVFQAEPTKSLEPMFQINRTFTVMEPRGGCTRIVRHNTSWLHREESLQ